MWRPQNLHNKDNSTLRSAQRRAFEECILEEEHLKSMDGFRASLAKGFQLSRKETTLLYMVRKGRHTTAVTGSAFSVKSTNWM